MTIGVGTIGSRPCHLSLNTILIKLDDERVTHVVMHRWNEVKTGVAKIEKYLMDADPAFFQWMLGLFRDAQLQSLEALEGTIPNDAYTHLRCCVVGEFRDAQRKLKDKQEAERAARRSKKLQP